MAPAATATGAHSREASAPAENRATSTPSKVARSTARTSTTSSANGSRTPADRGDASGTSWSKRNRRSSSVRSISRPTAPVAPSTATLMGSMLPSGWTPDPESARVVPVPGGQEHLQGELGLVEALGVPAQRDPPSEAVPDQCHHPLLDDGAAIELHRRLPGEGLGALPQLEGLDGPQGGPEGFLRLPDPLRVLDRGGPRDRLAGPNHDGRALALGLESVQRPRRRARGRGGPALRHRDAVGVELADELPVARLGAARVPHPRGDDPRDQHHSDHDRGPRGGPSGGGDFELVLVLLLGPLHPSQRGRAGRQRPAAALADQGPLDVLGPAVRTDQHVSAPGPRPARTERTGRGAPSPRPQRS